MVLIMGGSHGLGPIKKIIKYLEKANIEFQEVIVTGINRKLLRYLKNKCRRCRKPIKVYGYVDNIDELMAVSDLIITKPGGVTVSEALARGLPMLILKPIPGQEESNTLYLTKHAAAIKLSQENQVNAMVEDLFLNPAKLSALSRVALKMGKPASSLDIARFLFDLCNKNNFS